MALLLPSLHMEIFAILITCVIGIITYFKWSFTYWEKRKLPYITPVFPYGNMEIAITRKSSFGIFLKAKYDELKSQGHKHAGLYNFASPVYFTIHPEYVKNVMQNDFHHFEDRGIYYNEKDDPISANLVAVDGEKWKNLRVKLTPTFTSGKMKMMFETLLACSHPMKEVMDEFVKNKQPVDIKEMIACFTTDIIDSTAFGLECNNFKNSESEFRKHGKKVLKFSKVRALKTMFLLSQPKLGRALGATLLPQDSAHFFLNVVKDTVKYRENNNIVRKDMLQLLIELKNNNELSENDKHDGKALSIEEIAAQAYIFFVAGFETSSTTMTFCLFELATNQELQEKVRKEINEVLEKHDGKVTYEAMTDMKYMGQVIDETLRKYPPIPLITRKCVKDYKVPDTDVIIEKGTTVFISPLGLQHDPEYFYNPEKFDPERFSEENKQKIIPFSYIPFGGGPRVCIGLRFGIMQTKVGLTVLLKNYKFSLNVKTETPLKIAIDGFILSTEGGVWLDAKQIN